VVLYSIKNRRYGNAFGKGSKLVGYRGTMIGGCAKNQASNDKSSSAANACHCFQYAGWLFNAIMINTVFQLSVAS
jgi:hypothetical protein